MVSSKLELAANASAWNIDVGGATSSGTSFAYFRAFSLSKIYKWNDSSAIPEVPEGAEWYISQIHVGRLFESRFSGSEDVLRANLGGGLGVVSGSVSTLSQKAKITSNYKTIGLEPVGGDAIFAKTDAEMKKHYTSKGDARPILVVYSRLPRNRRRAAGPPEECRLSLETVTFPERKPRINAAWDGLGGRPDIHVSATYSGTKIMDKRAPKNSLSHNFKHLLSEAITVGKKTPLIFHFQDIDGISHDSAGSIIIASQPVLGDSRHSNKEGVNIVLRCDLPN